MLATNSHPVRLRICPTRDDTVNFDTHTEAGVSDDAAATLFAIQKWAHLLLCPQAIGDRVAGAKGESTMAPVNLYRLSLWCIP